MKIDQEELTHQIIGAAFEVRKNLGRFLFESVYEEALKHELKLRGIEAENQVYLPVSYKGVVLEKSFRIDLLVNKSVCIELKALETMGSEEVRQILSYMKFGDLKLGYLINFGAKDFTIGEMPDTKVLDKGIYRLRM